MLFLLLPQLIMQLITNPLDIANAFKNYFNEIANDVQSPIRFSNKKYFDYLPPLNIESFFITPTDGTEVSSFISTLNIDVMDLIVFLLEFQSC